MNRRPITPDEVFACEGWCHKVFPLSQLWVVQVDGLEEFLCSECADRAES